MSSAATKIIARHIRLSNRARARDRFVDSLFGRLLNEALTRTSRRIGSLFESRKAAAERRTTSDWDAAVVADDEQLRTLPPPLCRPDE